MSLCPFADIKLLPENATQPRINPRAVIAHSQAGHGSLYGFFKNGTSLESTFWISEEGKIEQYMDTEVRADANGQANTFAISIETESSVLARERWNPKQAAALVKLIDWCCTEHNIPRRQMKHKDDSGLGWHVMFGAPGPWTPSRGKTCPGPARIPQFQNEIIPAVAAGGKDISEPTTGDFLMALSDKQQDELYLWTKALYNDYGQKGKGVRQVIAKIDARTEEGIKALRNLIKK